MTAWESTRWRVQCPRKVEELVYYPNAALFRLGYRLMVLSDQYPRGPYFLTLTRRVW